MSCGDDSAIPRHFASWDDYWAVRHDPELWLPYFHQALRLAEMSPAGLVMLRPSQYPHARAGDVVITIYPDASIARDTFALELEAHSLVAGHGLPIPTLLAHGNFSTPDNGSQWNWLIESAATGLPWSQAKDGLPVSRAQQTARDLGGALRRLHEIAHDKGRILKPDWQRFDDLIEDELAHLGTDDGRLDAFPEQFRPALRDLAASTFNRLDTNTPTSLLHGDVHGDNVFIDPYSGDLRSLIDLNEMYAGDGWYDLADACFRLLGGAPRLTSSLLRGYGIASTAESAAAGQLLGWALLHDFDGITDVVRHRGIPASIHNIEELAAHLTGLQPADPT